MQRFQYCMCSVRSPGIMNLKTRPYLEQKTAWPIEGRHILAQYDADTIVVYQAYSPAIGCYAAEHGHFGGDFSYSRMSWIKPNFLWMMFRSGWGTKPGQEITLAVRLKRPFFDQILAAAVPSTHDPALFNSYEGWKKAVARSDVRRQWDPDHGPSGEPLQRRAIQLGLRGKTLAAYGQRETVEIIDLTAFVVEQRRFVEARAYSQLVTPEERVYPQPAAR